MTGLYSPANYAWQSGNPTANCAVQNYVNRTNSTVAINYDNVAIFQYYMSANGTRRYSNYNSLARATFTINESYRPIISSTPGQTSPPANTSGWVDDRVDGSPQTYSYTVRATDRGTGVQRLTLAYPSMGAPQFYSNPTSYRSCSGTRGSSGCPANGGGHSATFQYQLPEGVNTLSQTAYDVVGNASCCEGSWTQRIDRTGPTVNTPSGSLLSSGQPLRADRPYELSVSAHDGTSQVMGSGVKSLDIYVDGEETPRASMPPPTCNEPGNGCPATGTFRWDIPSGEFTDGQHTIDVVVTDQLGHTGSLPGGPVTINVAGDEEPPVVVLGSTPTGDGTVVNIDATDPGTVSTGVTHMEAYVDGQLVFLDDQTCPGGGCSMSRQFLLTPNQSPDSHQVDIYLDDQGGQTSYARLGQRRPIPQNFGFNELWATIDNAGGTVEKYDQLANDAGASILRFPLEACSVMQENGDFAVFDRNLKRYSRLNTTGGSGDDVQLLVVLLGDPDCGKDPTQIKESSWRNYVNKVLSLWGPKTRTGGQTPSDPTDDIDYGMIGVELGNEPNNPDFWAPGTALINFVPDPDMFATLVNWGSRELEAYNGPLPEGRKLDVLAGGLLPLFSTPGGPNNPNKLAIQHAFQRALYPQLNADRLTALSVHLYANVAQKPAGVRRRIFEDGYGDFMTTLPNKFDDKPVWITEVGFPAARVRDESKPGRPFKYFGSEKLQEQRLTEVVRKLSHKPAITTIIVHRLVDNLGNEVGRQGVINRFCDKHRVFDPLAELVTGENSIPARSECNPGT